jgi:heme oxygenase
VFLRNLVPVYGELERGLERHRDTLGLSRLCRSELRRSSTLEHDLVCLVGDDWGQSVPLLPEATLYADRVAAAAEGDGSLLIAHAYTRYLGDLAGGPVLKRRLASMLDFAGVSLAFYEFPGIPDPTAFFRQYRAELDSAASEFDDVDRIIEESIIAFQHNIDLSEAVQRLEGRTVSLGGD